MSFLQPWALALAALVAVPVLLHLLRRDVARRVPFPALRYLEAAEREHARSIRLRDLLLLGLRAALVLALALAAAGPLVGRGDTRDHHPTDVAILIDNSASAQRPLDGGTTLDALLARARGTLEAAGPDDRFWILPAVGPPLAAGLTAPGAAAALDRVEPSDGRAELDALVRDGAAALPAAPGREREIHLLSDLQATGVGSGADGPVPGIALVVGRVAPPAEPNGAVAAAELSGGSAAPAGSPVHVTAVPRLFAPDPTAAAGAAPEAGRRADPPGGAASGSASLRLEVDGRTAGLAVAPWGSSAVLPLPALAPGWHAGRVEIDPSGLRADDARWFALRVLPPPRVAHEGPGDGFLAEAIAILREAGRLGAGPRHVRVTEGVPAGGAPAAGGADAAFLVPPAEPLELPAFNQRLAAAGLGWVLEAERASGDLGLRETAAVPGLEETRVASRYRLAAAGGAGGTDTLLRTTDGEPWLVRGVVRGTPVVLILSPLVPEATTLPVSAPMIPFLETVLLRWTHADETGGSDVRAGEPVRLPPRADSVVFPDGGGRRVEGGAGFLPLRAGVYRILAGPETTEALFAAGVPAAESDLRAASLDELAAALGGARPVDGGEDETAWREAVFRARRGEDVAPWLLAAAAALVVAEALIAAPGRRRRRDAAGGAPGGGRAASGA